MLGSWVLIDVFLQFNHLSCSLSQVFIYFPLLLPWGGFFESSGLFGLFIKEGQTALLVGKIKMKGTYFEIGILHTSPSRILSITFYS